MGHTERDHQNNHHIFAEKARQQADQNQDAERDHVIFPQKINDVEQRQQRNEIENDAVIQDGIQVVFIFFKIEWTNETFDSEFHIK